MSSVVDFAFRKWDGSPHWVHPSVVLGADESGLWLGQRHGMISRRPGAEWTPYTVSVTLLPPGGGWVSTFFPPRPGSTLVYADIVAELDTVAFTACDMDLDVILRDGRSWIDDEDEFELHRAAMRYPDAVADRCRADAAAVLALIRAGHPPFDGRADRWLAVMEASTPL